MQLGMIGLGRMGSNMVRRLLGDGHECVVFDPHAPAVAQMEEAGAIPAESLEALVDKLQAPRAIWIMIPAAVVDSSLASLIPLLATDDMVIDGGNSHYHDDLRRAAELEEHGIHYVDVGTSGGVWGLERGYCMMIGGEPEVVAHLDPIFASLAPSPELAPPTPGREGRAGTAGHGYLHCGPSGAGHFVKMVHNGIEYGVMAAYAEGFNILHKAGIGDSSVQSDAETTPLEHPEHYRYDLDVADIAEVWRRGSVISSWLLDLIARALADDPGLESFAGNVADSGEGRWTLQAAIEQGVPAHVLAAALFERFSSRGESDFSDRLLSAMRFQFGGHVEKKSE